MADLSYPYIKKRGEFGKQPQFCEQGPEFCDTIVPNFAEHKMFILRNPVNEEVQISKPWSDHEVNTKRVKSTSSGMNHAEGGWPIEVNYIDPESTQRYRRRVEKEEQYIHCVNSCAKELEHYVLQNNAIDMYYTYFSENPPQPKIEKSFFRSLNVYRETSDVPRSVSCIDWNPEGGHKFVASYIKVDFDRNPLAAMSANIWDVEHAASPEMVLESSCPILNIKYSLRNPNFILGGLMNGRIAVWDVRAGSHKVSAPHNAHRDLVRMVKFINSKSGMECFSAGADGVLKWWDIRNLEEPTDEMVVDIVKTHFDTPVVTNAWGITVLEYEPTMPTRFMVGTENGYVVAGNRKGKSQIDKFAIQYNAHYGPVVAVERNPVFLKVFLSVGDWTLRVWSEDCRESAILMSPPQLYNCTCAQWSPIRYSLILVAQTNGYISCWDLLKNQSHSIVSVKVCQEALVTLNIHENGHIVACGSENGNIYTQELSPNLVTNEKHEKLCLQAVFDRESKREKILEARMREIKLKMRSGEEGGGSVHSLGDVSIGDKELEQVSEDYFTVVHKEMSHLV